MTGSSPSTEHLAEPERIEFQNTIEGVLTVGLKSEMSGPLKEKLKAAGLDMNKPLLPGYPPSQVFKWIAVAASHIFPGDSTDEGVRKLGMKSVTGLQETMLGKALKGALMIIGTRRSLHRAQRAFRSNNNYTEVTLAELSPTCMNLTLNHVNGYPTFYQGVFAGACELIGAKNCTVEILEKSLHGATYQVRWDA